MIKRSLPFILGALATACAGEPPQMDLSRPDTRVEATAASVPDSPSTAAPHDRVSTSETTGDGDLNTIPIAACEPEAYTEFVNAFAQFAEQRPRFVTGSGRVELPEFDVALVDYRWQRESDGVFLELTMTRRGSRVDVVATPVERDAEDQPVRTLGPARRYAFEHRDGCWRYAGRF